MSNETILITGGTGLIGVALTDLLIEKGYKIIILSRNPSKNQHSKHPNVSYAAWDIKAQTIDDAAIRESDHIIHLAGAGIADKRWTRKRKEEIIESRTHSSGLLVKALKEIPNKVKSVISSSAIGWYGEDPQIPNPKPFKESAPSAPGFLGETCEAWEKSIQPVTQLNKRLVILRTGIVFSKDGGAYYEFRKPLKFGFATILGEGRQIISWIHKEDIARIYIHAIEHPEMSGVFNAVTTHHVSNKSLILQIAQKLRGRFFIPVYVPSFALKLVLGELSVEVLKSATIDNEKIRHAGFQFLYPSLDSALNELTGRSLQIGG